MTDAGSAPKRIVSSHLALRFYKHEGWTKEILDRYIRRGRVRDQIEGQEVRDYWFLDHEQGSQFDIERLFAEESPRVFHWKDHELFRDHALAYLKEMNW